MTLTLKAEAKRWRAIVGVAEQKVRQHDLSEYEIAGDLSADFGISEDWALNAIAEAKDKINGERS